MLVGSFLAWLSKFSERCIYCGTYGVNNGIRVLEQIFEGVGVEGVTFEPFYFFDPRLFVNKFRIALSGDRVDFGAEITGFLGDSSTNVAITTDDCEGLPD